MSNIALHLKEEHLGMTTELYVMRYVFEETGVIENSSYAKKLKDIENTTTFLEMGSNMLSQNHL